MISLYSTNPVWLGQDIVIFKLNIAHENNFALTSIVFDDGIAILDEGAPLRTWTGIEPVPLHGYWQRVRHILLCFQRVMSSSKLSPYAVRGFKELFKQKPGLWLTAEQKLMKGVWPWPEGINSIFITKHYNYKFPNNHVRWIILIE